MTKDHMLDIAIAIAAALWVAAMMGMAIWQPGP